MQLADSVREVSAPECVRLAQLTDDPALRLVLLNIARDWMANVTQEMGDSEAVPDQYF